MPTYRTDELSRAANDLADADDPGTRETSAIAYVTALLRAVTPPEAQVFDCVRYVESMRPAMAFATSGLLPQRVTVTAELTNRIVDTRADLISTVHAALASADEKSIDLAALRHSEAIAKTYDLVTAQRLMRVRHFLESSS